MKITTSVNPLLEWEAITDSYEPGAPMGLGKTEREAIEDLVEKMLEAAATNLSQATLSWVSVDERTPADEQTVIGYWPNVGICTPFFESVTYYAADAPDGPEAWRNAWGEDTDAPHYWMPQSGLPEAPK